MVALGLVFLAVMACMLFAGFKAGLSGLPLEEMYVARKLTGGKISALLKDEKGEVRAELEAEAENQLSQLQAEYDALDVEIKDAEAKAAKVQERRELGARIDHLTMPVSAPAGATPLVTNMHDNILDDPRGGFRTIGGFAQDIAAAAAPSGAESPALKIYAAATGMSQGMGAEGGYAVPREYGTTAWDALRQDEDSLLSLCDVYTVTGESLDMLAVDETTRADGSRYGGVLAYWAAEAALMTASKPKLRRVKLEPHELHAFIYASNKLLRNAPAIQQLMNSGMIAAIKAKINAAIMAGDGVGKPLGVLNGLGLISITIETGQAAKTVVPENIAKMYARRLGNPMWFINQTVETQLLLMTLERGTSMWPVYMPPGGLASAPNGSILGKPVMTTEHCKTLGTEGDIQLNDMKAYIVGTKGTVDTAMSIHLRFDYNESVFRTIFEVDGQPWMQSAVTPENGDSLAPTISLAVRA
ncbi:hypothetical protein LCGC14_1852680 [marine sediment metagenome]|uniref:Phage capsid-like C-terminal domain-containing protein n=1 Tax=marine sediment metagenome TaxID=412755 RepID=A0A0F9GY46_9ZZZZ